MMGVATKVSVALLLLAPATGVAEHSQSCSLGDEQFMQQRYREAQITLWKCVASGTETPDEAVNLASTYREIKNYDEGLARVRDEMKRRHGDEDLIYMGAFLQFRRGEFENSVALLNLAYKLNPNDWRLHQLYALNYVEAGWASAAEQEFNRAITLKSDLPELYYQLARYYYTMSAFGKAVTASEKALALAPQYADAYDNLGLTYAGLGNYSASADNFEKAIKLNQEHNVRDEWPLVDYGASLEDHDPNQAMELLQEAVQMNSANATAYYELGRTMQNLGRDSDAEINLREAIIHDPTYTNAYYILSALARKRGDRVASTKYMAEFKRLRDQEKKDKIFDQILSMRHR